MQYNLPVVETANLHVSSTKYFQEDVCNGLDLVLGKHSCVHLKLESSLREGRGGEGRGGEGRGGEGRGGEGRGGEGRGGEGREGRGGITCTLGV